jgi:hypothetical protein
MIFYDVHEGGVVGEEMNIALDVGGNVIYEDEK